MKWINYKRRRGEAGIFDSKFSQVYIQKKKIRTPERDNWNADKSKKGQTLQLSGQCRLVFTDFLQLFEAAEYFARDAQDVIEHFDIFFVGDHFKSLAVFLYHQLDKFDLVGKPVRVA